MTAPSIDAAEIQRYLALLFPDPPSDAWLVTSRLDAQKRLVSRWFLATQTREAVTYMVSQARRANVYVGLGLRHPDCTRRADTRGGSADVMAIPGLWIELDHNAGAHASPHLPTPDELLTFIKDLPFTFSLLVDSSGGYHGYCLFKELWLLDTPDEHQAATLLLRRFQRTVQARAAARGWKVDTTSDLARVLRPAGTLNHKTGTPRPVSILHEDAVRYNPSDLADAPWLATIEDTYTPPSRNESFALTQLAPIVDGCAWLRHCRDDAATLPEPEWYSMLGIVGRSVEGDTTAHEWSAPYPRYSKEETTRKLTHALADAGPSTCSSIRYDRAGESYCRECQHWGKIKSPIVLGMTRRRTRADEAAHDQDGLDEVSPTASALRITTMDAVERQPVEWLWWPYIPLGMLCIVDGDPGIGKSLLMTQLAASLSRGYPLPDQQGSITLPSGGPAATLLLSVEDSLPHTLKPRLEEAGADCTRIHVVTGWTDDQGQEQAFTLAQMPLLAACLQQYQPRLCIIDPIQSVLGSRVDMNRDNQVRPLLDGLKLLAERHNCAMVLIRHPSKPGQGIGKVIHRGLGSVGFIATARTALFCEQHPTDPAKVLLAQSKSNIGPLGRTQRFTKHEGQFAWCGVSRLSAEVLGGSGRGPDPHAYLEAVCWLEQRLEGNQTWPSTDIQLEAEAEGIGKKTLFMASKRLGIDKKQDRECWTWRLPPLPILSFSTTPTGDTGLTGLTGLTGKSDSVIGEELSSTPHTPDYPDRPVASVRPVSVVVSDEGFDEGVV